MNGRGEHWAADFPIISRLGLTWLRTRRTPWIIAGGILAAVAIAAITLELRSSWFQSLVFRAAARYINYHLAPGPSKTIHYPEAGPYDWTLGYARMPVVLVRLKEAGFQIQAQARDSALYSMLTGASLYPIYRQKDQAGLQITDRDGNPLYVAKRPQRIYSSYDSIPPIVVRSLLFVENRHMLEPQHPYHNPAVEWDRLTKAALNYGLHVVSPHRSLIGGSTLATQLTKMRHSPEGRTHTPVDKFRQMASATFAVYQHGRKTLPTQREIVRSYINAMPLAASAGYGDVTGLGDGLWAWYGADLAEVNRLLRASGASLNASEAAKRARAYREVLSLILSVRAPHRYLVEDPKALDARTDRFLSALADHGIISARLRDQALRARVRPLERAPYTEPVNFVENKAANTIRMRLVPLLGVADTYDLDRLDLTVQTTIDRKAQQGVTQFLEQIGDRQQAGAAGLQQFQLLEQSDPSKVVYSFTLYERGPGVNYLRVDTDNLNQPININQDTRLELGSTAKLRTLINYLEIVSDLHKQYAGMSAKRLASLRTFPDDHLTEWALQYLAGARDRSLEPMLEAALERKYSGSTGESFFTAGGVHHFENFESTESGIMTVSEAFQNSVNLVFVRLMRDIVNYYRFRVPGASPAVLEDGNDPARRKYLARFADQEGRTYLTRFYDKYRGQTPDQSLNTLVHSVALTPLRAAVIYRSVRPWAGLDQFTAFLKRVLPAGALVREDPAKLYEKYGPDKFNLSDRGYLAHVHPLELWMLNYRERHPLARRNEIFAHSARERQDVYWWLFQTQHKTRQDNRIRTLLEQDAFQPIYRAWKRQGYPFDSLVPSYATCIGVSGDTPAALAELMGILANGGIRYPSIKIKQLHFGPETPTETVVAKQLPQGESVIAPEIVTLVRKQLIGVVENGTARRAHGGIVLADGQAIPVGGKTGTGDNRLESFTANGRLIGSKPVSRTAAFAFMIGDRFYGTVLAFVPGDKAASYRFTSALAVQIFKDLTPVLTPMIERQQPQAPTQQIAYRRAAN